MKLLKKITLSMIIILSSITALEAKVPKLPTICTKGGTAIVLIRSINVGDGFYANLKHGKQDISAYCDVGDCEFLYDHKITNVKARVTLNSMYMEEHEDSLTCSITDMEVNPYVE